MPTTSPPARGLPAPRRQPSVIVLPIGSSFGKYLSRGALGDHHDSRRALLVVVGEVAAPFQRNPDRAEVVRRRHAGLDRRLLARGERRPPGNRKGQDDAGAAEGQRQHAGRRLHPRDRSQPRQQLVEEGDLPLVLFVACVGQRHLEGERLLGVEPGVDGGELREAADQEPGAGEQHHRERHLGHDQRAAHPRPAAIGDRATPGLLQRSGQAGRRRLERGHHPEDEAGHDRQAERERDHVAVDPHVVQPRNTGRLEPDQHVDAPDRQQQPETAADDAEDDAFGEELADEAAAGGAERAAHRHLAFARRRAREQQVGDVGAGDQQDEADGAEKHQHGLADVADHRLVERDRGEVEPLVAVRILRGEALADGLHLGSDVLEWNARLGPADGSEVPRAALAGGEVRVVGDRHPDDPAGRVGEALRHHPHDLGRYAVDRDLLPDRVVAAAEALAPQPVADDRDLAAAWVVLVGPEGAAERGAHTEEVEQRGADLGGVEPHGLPLAGEDDAGPGDRGRVRQRLALFLDVGEVRPRHRRPAAFGEVIDPHEPLRVLVRQGLEQHAVHDAEDGAVGADAQRQRQHGDGGERGALDQAAEGVANVLAKGIHRGMNGARCVPNAVTAGRR